MRFERLRHARALGEPYDVALVDMAMPGRDGMELARLIRAKSELVTTSLVLLSSADVEPEAATNAGFVAILIEAGAPL